MGCTEEVRTLKEAGVFDDDLNFSTTKLACIFPNRCVIFKLSEGVLAFSPSKLLGGMKEFIDELGGVKVVMAAHGFNLMQWREFWPNAIWLDMPSLKKDNIKPDCSLKPDSADNCHRTLNDARVSEMLIDIEIF